MLKTSRWFLMAAMILGGGVRASGESVISIRPAAQMTPEMLEIRNAQDRLMKEAAPELYAFQKKLRDIDAEIDEIVGSLAKKEIDKETAKENMLPLIKGQQEVQNDPEFLIEQRLAQTYFSSPEYRAKEEKVMRALAERQKR